MNTKTKNILLIVLGVAVVGMTVAFAALSSQLKIQGTASVPNVSWNIHFQNWDDNTEDTVTYGGNTHQNTAVFPAASTLTKTLSPNVTKVDGLNVTLYQPGDYASYTFEIINEGTIDASLDNFTHNLTCASGNDCSHLSYTVECVDSQNNNVLTGNPTLAKNGGLAYCTLTVTYTDQTNQNSGTAGSNQVYTPSAASATLDATWVYVQKMNDNNQSGNNSNIPSSSFTYSYISGDTTNALSHDVNGNYWYSDIGNDWVTYLKNDGTTTEVCGKFPSGTVCYVGNSNGYASDFANCSSEQSVSVSSCLTGYAKTVVDEMIAKGGACTIRQQFATCQGGSSQGSVNGCDINPDGYISCDSGDAHVCDSTGSVSMCY